MVRFSAPSIFGATNITASTMECDGDFALRLKISGEDAFNDETIAVWFGRYGRSRVEAYAAAINTANRQATASVVQIGDHDPEYRRKLDAVSEIVAAPEFGGDAA